MVIFKIPVAFQRAAGDSAGACHYGQSFFLPFIFSTEDGIQSHSGQASALPLGSTTSPANVSVCSHFTVKCLGT